MTKTIKIWFDAEADFLEVRFSDAPAQRLEKNRTAVTAFSQTAMPTDDQTLIAIRCL